MYGSKIGHSKGSHGRVLCPTEAVAGKHHQQHNSQGNIYSITGRQNDDETTISELAEKGVCLIMEITVPGGN
jgi:hypothetical protein